MKHYPDSSNGCHEIPRLVNDFKVLDSKKQDLVVDNQVTFGQVFNLTRPKISPFT